MSFLNDEDGFDDPLDFNEVQFQKVDEHLRCPICKELLNATMMLNTCSHSFCALCIRRSLNTEQLCPKCRKPAYENNLIHNYDLDNVVHTWRESRNLFLKLDQMYNSKSQQEAILQQPIPTMQHLVEEKNTDSLYQPTTVVIDDDDTDDFVPNYHKNASPISTPTRRSTRLRKPVDQGEEIPSTEEKLHSFEKYDSQESNTVINSKINDLHVSHSGTNRSQINQTQANQPQIGESLVSQMDNYHLHLNSHQYHPPYHSHNDKFQSNKSQTAPYQADKPAVNTLQTQNHPDELKTTTMVQCPICSQHMKYNVLDRHIDKCLQGDSRIPPDPPQASSSSGGPTHALPSISNRNPKMKVPAMLKRQDKPVNLGKKPVKLVYAMMSDKELRDCLRSLNLPDHGDKAQKVWRHKEYINLYNANYDSHNPVSAQVLVQRLQTIENSQLAEKANQLKRKATDIESHKTKYADHFANLIASAKKSKPSKEL